MVKTPAAAVDAQPDSESEPMQIDGANVSFPETDEERERKSKEEEEDKTPPRKYQQCLVHSAVIHPF